MGGYALERDKFSDTSRVFKLLRNIDLARVLPYQREVLTAIRNRKPHRDTREKEGLYHHWIGKKRDTSLTKIVR